MATNESISESTSRSTPEPSSPWRLEVATSLFILIGLAAIVLGAVSFLGYRAAGSYWGWGQLTIPGNDEVVRGRQFLLQADGGDTDAAKAKLKDAASQFDAAIKSNERHATAYFLLGKVQQLQGEADAALADYDKAIACDNDFTKIGRGEEEALHAVPLGFDRAEAFCNRAILRSAKGMPAEAITDFTAALAANGDYTLAYCGRADVYLKMNNPEQAILDANEAVGLMPEWSEPRRLRARANLAAGHYEQAEVDARQAIQDDAKCADAYATLAAALAKQGHAEAAQRAADTARSLGAKVPFPADDPELTARKKMLADADTLLEKPMPPYSDAVNLFAAILRNDPDNVGALRGRGVCFVETKDWDLAIVDLDRLVSLKPQSADARRLRARAYLGKSDFYAARQDAIRAISLAPDNSLAYLYCAQAYFGDKEFETALDCLRKGVAVDKMSPRVNMERDAREVYLAIHEARVRELAKAGRWDQLPESMAAIAKPTIPFGNLAEPSVADRLRLTNTWQEVGFDRLKAQDWGQAIRALEEASRALEEVIHASNKEFSPDPSRVQLLDEALARAYVERGNNQLAAHRWDDAVADFKKAIAIDKSKVDQLADPLAQTYAERGLAAAKRRDFNSAVADLNAALDLSMYSAKVDRICGWVCSMMADECHRRGRTTEEKQRWRDAIDYFTQAIRLDTSLEHELKPILDYSQRNYLRVSAPVVVVPSKGS